MIVTQPFPGHLKAEERNKTPKTWKRTVEKEREESGWGSWAEARVAAADRDGWRRSVDALFATRHETDMSQLKHLFESVLICT